MEVIDKLRRCSWCTQDFEYIKYHDTEWGVPIYDDNKLFELLTLEGAQAGLSWLTVLKKRQAYRQDFHNFDIEKVAKLNTLDVDKLIINDGIIRNRLKIQSVVKNAQAILDIAKQHGSFNSYLWRYVTDKPLNNLQSKHAIDISVILSKDLKKYGMNFVGPTICFAFMQASGMINDHSKTCFRYKQLI